MASDPILEIFREEARDHLAALEKLFLDLEAAPTVDARRKQIVELFRHAHSLKGDARVVGVADLRQSAQTLEDILDELQQHPEAVDRAAINRGLAQFDKVHAAFEAWQTGDSAPAEPSDGRTSAQAEPAVADRAASAAAVAALAAGTAVSGPVAPPPSLPGPASPDAASLPSPASQGPAPEPAAEESFTVRVPSERLDRMLSLLGELRASQRSGMALAERLADLREHLATIVVACDPQTAGEARSSWEGIVDQVRRVESELRQKRSREELLLDGLESDVRHARLLPMVMLTDSLRRAVRDLAHGLGKSIKYEADVGKILLDKAVIEALQDPLLHLVRNAADHGLETPEERRAAGKPIEGTLRVEARQHGRTVRIAVSDDGRGVDYPRIRARLRQSGEADDATIAGLSERELGRHLFRPGFTTAPAGEFSGRGVGLDVVQSTVRRLQGSVGLHCVAGRAGTTFVLEVPATVATVRVLSVVAAGQFYAVLSASVAATGRAARQQLRPLEGRFVLPRDHKPVPWVHLADLLGVGPRTTAADDRPGPYLLVTRDGHELAVAVDELEEESEVLLKPLGFPLGGLPGVAGATIRADGSVQLVLDVIDLGRGESPRGPAPAGAERRPLGRILVVDDSPTTRAVLRNVFTAAGYTVRTATDGIDALERLRAQPADVVVSDVEMPRLNGFDLTRHVKSKYGLPVILVTGKEKDEQRREGMEAGADAYVVKSTFQGEGLLEIVQQFVDAPWPAAQNSRQGMP